MFGSLSFNEILFILVLALLIFGPKRLPQIGRTLGKTLGEFRRATSDLKRSMEVEMTMAEERETAAGAPKPRLASGSESRQESATEPAIQTGLDAAPEAAPEAEPDAGSDAGLDAVWEQPLSETLSEPASEPASGPPREPADAD